MPLRQPNREMAETQGVTDEPDRLAASISRRALVLGLLLLATALAGVDAWLFFRARSTMLAIRSGRGPAAFDLHYADIRMAWFVGVVALVVSVAVLIATPFLSGRVMMAGLLLAAAVPLVVSVPTSPAHFVFGEPVVAPMDPGKFGRSAWLCIATAAAVALLAAVLASRWRRVATLASPASVLSQWSCRSWIEPRTALDPLHRMP